MATKKSKHPADAFNAEILANAVSYNVHLRISPTRKVTEAAATIAEALDIRDKVRAEYSKLAQRRDPMIYAVDAAGRSTLIPKDQLPATGEAADEAFDIEQASAEEPIAEAPASKPKKGKTAPKAPAAAGGDLPAIPDLSAPCHARYLAKMAEVLAMAKAGDIAGLKAFEIKTNFTTGRKIGAYRDAAIAALEGRAA